MNDELASDIQRLQQATAPRGQTFSLNDRDTKALRGSLLRLGELNDRAAEDFDAAAFLNRLQTSISTNANSPIAPRQSRPWLLPASIAGGVVAAAVIFFLCQSFLNFDVDFTTPAVATNDGTKVPGEVLIPPPATFVEVAPWRDVLDDQLILAQRRADQVGFFPSRSTELTLLQERVRYLHDDLRFSAL